MKNICWLCHICLFSFDIFGPIISIIMISHVTDVSKIQVLCWQKGESELEQLKSRLSQLYYENLLQVRSVATWILCTARNTLYLYIFMLVQLETPMEGLKEWLDALYTASIPCAVVSCLDRRNMLESLQRMGLTKYFQVGCV